MSKNSKRFRETDKRWWVENPPWYSWWTDVEAWSYDTAMKLLKERGLWTEVPEGVRFVDYCDEVLDMEDSWLSFADYGEDIEDAWEF